METDLEAAAHGPVGAGRPSTGITKDAWQSMLSRMRWKECFRLVLSQSSHHQPSQKPRGLSKVVPQPRVTLKTEVGTLAPVEEEGAVDVSQRYLEALGPNLDDMIHFSLSSIVEPVCLEEEAAAPDAVGGRMDGRRGTFVGMTRHHSSFLSQLRDLKPPCVAALRAESQPADTAKLAASPQPRDRHEEVDLPGLRAPSLSLQDRGRRARSPQGRGAPMTGALSLVRAGGDRGKTPVSPRLHQMTFSNTSPSVDWRSTPGTSGLFSPVSHRSGVTPSVLDWDEFSNQSSEWDAQGRGDYSVFEMEPTASTDESPPLSRHDASPAGPQRRTRFPDVDSGLCEGSTRRKGGRAARQKSERRTLQRLVAGLSRPLAMAPRQPRPRMRAVRESRDRVSPASDASSAISAPLIIHVNTRHPSHALAHADPLKVAREMTVRPATTEPPASLPRGSLPPGSARGGRSLGGVLQVKKAHIRQTCLLWSSDALAVDGRCAACRVYKPCLGEQAGATAKSGQAAKGDGPQMSENISETRERILKRLRLIQEQTKKVEKAWGHPESPREGVHKVNWHALVRQRQAGIRMIMMMAQARQRCILPKKFFTKLRAGPSDAIEDDLGQEEVAVEHTMELAMKDESLTRELEKRDVLSASLAAELAACPFVSQDNTSRPGNEELEEREEELGAQSYQAPFETLSDAQIIRRSRCESLFDDVEHKTIRISSSDPYLDDEIDEFDDFNVEAATGAASTFGKVLQRSFLRTSFSYEDILLSREVEKEGVKESSPDRLSTPEDGTSPRSSRPSTNLKQLLMGMQRSAEARSSCTFQLMDLMMLAQGQQPRTSMSVDNLDLGIADDLIGAPAVISERTSTDKSIMSLDDLELGIFDSVRSVPTLVIERTGEWSRLSEEDQGQGVATSLTGAQSTIDQAQVGVPASECLLSGGLHEGRATGAARKLSVSLAAQAGPSQRRKSTAVFGRARRRSSRNVKKRKDKIELEEGPVLEYGVEAGGTEHSFNLDQEPMVTRFVKYLRPSRWLQKLEFPYYYMKGEAPPKEEQLQLPVKNKKPSDPDLASTPTTHPWST